MDPLVKDWIDVGFGIVQVLAFPVTIAFAFVGLSQWRREAAGERNSELTEEIEIALNRLVNALARVRSPFGFGGEGSSRPRKENETSEDTRQLDNAFVHLERMRKEEEVFLKIDDLQIKANVRFRGLIEKELAELQTLVRKLSLAAMKTYRDAQRPVRRLSEKQLQGMEENDALIWSRSSPGEPDAFDAEVRQVQASITAKLQPYKL